MNSKTYSKPAGVRDITENPYMIRKYLKSSIQAEQKPKPAYKPRAYPSAEEIYEELMNKPEKYGLCEEKPEPEQRIIVEFIGRKKTIDEKVEEAAA